MPTRMQSPYGKQSRTGLEATRNQRRCKRPFSRRIMKTLLNQEDANLKLLRSLPSAWNNISLIMRNKSDLDTLSMDDLYNNLKVYESKIKSQLSSCSNSHNVAFVSSDNSSSTNEIVNTAYSVSAASFKDQASTASYADDVIMDLEWKVAMLNIKVKRRGHFARECRAQRNQGNRIRDAPTRNAPIDTSTTNALVVQDGIVLNNVVDIRESDEDDNKVNDRFKKGDGYHAVPPSYTGNYMPPRADLSFAGLDNYVFKSKVSETITSVPRIEINASKTSKDSLEKPKTVRSSAPLIEEWESYSEDENVFKPKEVKKTVRPCLEKIEFVNAKNTTVENENKVEKPRKFSKSPRGNKRNWNGLITQKLRDGFEVKKKDFFVCGSINHLINDCNFYENKMVLNNKGKITGPKEIRPV
nr:hypothetical protein [Tanacetum cinerariifolium]